MIITREYLAQYSFLESKIKSYKRRLRYFENHPLASQHGIAKGSMEKFPYAECHFIVAGPSVKSNEERKNIISQLIVDIARKEQMYEDMKLDIEYFIERTQELDIETSTIFRLKYIDEWSLEKIGEELGYEKSTISKKIDKALDKLNNVACRDEVSISLR